VRAWWLVLVASSAHAEPFAGIFEPGRTWTYDVATTTYDIENWGSLTRPPKHTTHATVTCTSDGQAIACDGALEPAVAGRYEVTADGLVRDGRLVLAKKPYRKVTHDAQMNADRVEGVRGTCAFTDTSEVELDGATTEQCFTDKGVASGEFDGGGGDWRKVTYRLRATRPAPAAPSR